MPVSFLILCTLLLCLAFVEARLNFASNSDVGNDRNVKPKDATCSETPSAKTKVDFPESLAGRSIASSFDMYTGYINVTDTPDYLFYWFFAAQNGDENAPLVIWTNGGPGCSSMEGASTENTPLTLFDIKESCSSDQCDYSGQLSTNPYGWNARANVLYIDQPRYVGFSFGYGDYVTSSTDAGEDFVTFLTSWLDYFPEFKGRETIISGESYGGHYVPAMADAVMNYNEALSESSSQINLAGLFIGNGCVNNTVQNGDTYIDFLHAQKLIPDDATPRNEATAEAMMIKHIGYSPNYYDYRLESVSCSGCYGYNYSAWADWFLRDDVKEALGICGKSGDDAFSGSAGGCISIPGFDSHDQFDYSGALGRALDSGIPVTLLYGKADTACNYVGGYSMANTISWKGTQDFANTALQPLLLLGSQIGSTKTFGGLSWLEIESAGHMVPIDQPVGALLGLNTILDLYI